MFKENTTHIQGDLFGIFPNLSERKRKKLQSSPEYLFYKIIFCNIDEKKFYVLYSDKKSRPNTPVNVMFGALILKEQKGWSYSQLLDSIVPNAFGIRQELHLD